MQLSANYLCSFYRESRVAVFGLGDLPVRERRAHTCVADPEAFVLPRVYCKVKRHVLRVWNAVFRAFPAATGPFQEAEVRFQKPGRDRPQRAAQWQK